MKKKLFVSWQMVVGYPDEKPVLTAGFNVPIELYVTQRQTVMQQLEQMMTALKPDEEDEPLK